MITAFGTDATVARSFAVGSFENGVAGAGSVPVVVAMPVAILGTLLLLGAAVTVLLRRRSLAYLFVVLALVGFAGGVALDRLAAAGAIPMAAAHDAMVVVDATTVVLLLAAVKAVARQGEAAGADDEVGYD
jgi:hypothetical protein